MAGWAGGGGGGALTGFPLWQDAVMSGTGDQVVLVGAASKGIIQRDFQHNAMVYKSAYSKNPFDNISDGELEEYRRLVEKKQRGEPSKWGGGICRRGSCSRPPCCRS